MDAHIGNIEQDFVLMGLELPEPEPEPQPQLEPELQSEAAGVVPEAPENQNLVASPVVEEGEPPEQ